MPTPSPRPLTSAESRGRRDRVAKLARELGFVGRIEYRHVYSQSGGAQYGQGTTAANDLLTVFAEAFERNANPEDFSLTASVAHEYGHQLLARHPRIAPRVGGKISPTSEEVLASILGAMVCTDQRDRDALEGKALVELLTHGDSPEAAVGRAGELRRLLEALLSRLMQFRRLVRVRRGWCLAVAAGVLRWRCRRGLVEKPIPSTANGEPRPVRRRTSFRLCPARP
jgi:hypothetical protein